MSTHPTRLTAKALVATTRRIIVAAILSLMAALLVLSPSANAADQVAINDKVKDSIVQLRTTYTAWVEIPGAYMKSGRTHWVKTVAQFSCTGFVVDQTGYIATAGHCVDNTSENTKAAIRKQMLSNAVKNGMSEAKAGKILKIANAEQWRVEGFDRGSPINRTVEVRQPDDPARVIKDWTTAQVVQFQQSDDGDNALLKVSGLAPLNPLVVADDVPASGEELTVVGFPGSVKNLMDQSRAPQPSFKSGTASSQQIMPSGVPVTEVSADVALGMSGGPTINSDGEVVGINSFGMTGGVKGEVTNFITNAPALRTFLEQNGVNLAEPPASEKSFPWIWIGIAVGFTVVAGIILPVVLFVSLARKRRGTPQSQQSDLPAQSAQNMTLQPAGDQNVAVGYQQGPGGEPQPPRHQLETQPMSNGVQIT
jgi:serine protease Do